MTRSLASLLQTNLVRSRRSFTDQSRRPKRRVLFHGTGPRGISHGYCSAFCSEFAFSHARNPTARCSKASRGQLLGYSIDDHARRNRRQRPSRLFFGVLLGIRDLARSIPDRALLRGMVWSALVLLVS